MKRLKLQTFLAICVPFFLGACAKVISEYRPSAIHVETLKQKYGNSDSKVGIVLSELNTTETKSIMCRLDGPVMLPDNEAYEKYVLNALITEMKFADIFSEDADVVLALHFKRIDFNSNWGMGQWVIDADVYNGSDKSFAVSTKHDFDSSFNATMACAQVSEAFPDAVRSFIDDLVSQPEFDRALNGQKLIKYKPQKGVDHDE